MWPLHIRLRSLPSFALLVLLSFVADAYGHDESVGMDMGGPSSLPTVSAMPVSAATSYFQHDGYTWVIRAHIIFMICAWVFILPLGVMFSISRSRYSLPAQFSFLLVNAVGLVFGTVYNSKTPDLYPHNAHHKLGWILTWVMCAQVLMGVTSACTRCKPRPDFLPVSQQAMAEYHHLDGMQRADQFRLSNDSGHGTQENTESVTSSPSSDFLRPGSWNEDEYYKDEEEETQGLMHKSVVTRFMTKRLSSLLSRILPIFHFLSAAVNRVILILGFVALATGGVTYGGLFKGEKVFSGLAHFVKGGVFFWYGVLTLGRWAGCFSEIGWAWNIRPTPTSTSNGKGRRVSAEFVESFLIFFYGSTNVFLEHLTAWGNEWSAQDLEHVSLTVMFFGGGLCGMLIESTRIRDLLNTNQQAVHPPFDSTMTEGDLQIPKSYGFSMNPIPALIILLLGIMMSSHHQESMISTMIHSQWGNLLVGAAFARFATYMLLYLSPPTSTLPGRPPTELITAFCLIAGGIIFMFSARDTVEAMELHNLDAMFIFTVSMGVVTFLMAWIIATIAIKGWSVRRENSRALHGMAKECGIAESAA